MLSLIRIQKWLVFVLSGITLNMDEEQELTSLNWLLTSNVMPSGIETVPIEAPSSSLPANASSPALAPTKSKRLYLYTSLIQARSRQGSQRRPWEQSSEISKNYRKNFVLNPTDLCAILQIWDNFSCFHVTTYSWLVAQAHGIESCEANLGHLFLFQCNKF